MKRKKQSDLATCECCGAFYSLAEDADKRFCQQCKFVGCNLNKRGDRCRLQRMIPRPSAAAAHAKL